MGWGQRTNTCPRINAHWDSGASLARVATAMKHSRPVGPASKTKSQEEAFFDLLTKNLVLRKLSLCVRTDLQTRAAQICGASTV